MKRTGHHPSPSGASWTETGSLITCECVDGTAWMFLVTAVLSLMLSGCLPIPAGDLMPACPGGLEPAALSHPSPQIKTKANWLVNGKMLPTLVDKSTNSSGLGWRSCFTSESVLQGFAVGGAGGSGRCCRLSGALRTAPSL